VQKKRDYTIPAFLAFWEAVQHKVADLNRASSDAHMGAGGGSESSAAETGSGGAMTPKWTAIMCERALWAAGLVPTDAAVEGDTGEKRAAAPVEAAAPAAASKKPRRGR
jgi:hypothetical protein